MTSSEADRTVIVIDARTPEEYAGGHVEGARLIDFNGGEVADALPSLDRDAEYVVYCHAGGRAGKTVELMHEAGIENATNLGGLEDAAEKLGLPIVR